jgi:hypothetical protein
LSRRRSSEATGDDSPRRSASRLFAALGLAALVLGTWGSSGLARADEIFQLREPGEGRPRNWIVELKFSTVYYPNLDSGVVPQTFNNGSVTSPSYTAPQGPFHAVMGPHHRLLSQLEGDYAFWDGFGTLSVGLGFAYSEFYGRTYRDPGTGGAPVLTTDTTYFREVQTRTLLIYRLDPWPKVPLIPYVKGGLDWIYYWSTLSNGSISTSNGTSGDGLTTGFEFTLGMAFQLDVIDGTIAQDAYNSIGISHTYFVFDWTDQVIQNGPGNVWHGLWNGGRGAPPAVDISAQYFSFGVQFQF